MTSVDYSDLPIKIRNIFDASTLEEQTYLIRILEELERFGYSDTYEDIWLSDYTTIPVDIDTFLTDNRYLGLTNRQGAAVYPTWRSDLRTVFSAGNKYTEWILTGATRTGKSSTAVTAVIYMLYKLMCLRDPQEFFGKKDVSKFSILFFNITKDLASGVSYREFNDTLKRSPWFNHHGTFSKSERKYYYIPEGDKILVDFGSDGSHALGTQIYTAIMDECNFSQAGVKDYNKAKAKMQDTYNTIKARVGGTFKHGGEIFGKIFAVSSKRSDSDFIETYKQQQLDAGREDIYVSDRPQWDVLPPDTFSPDTFYIAVGDRHQRGFVVPDNQTFPEALADLQSHGFMILQPPVDMKSDFLADFHIALRDLAGIAVVGSMSFITQESIEVCINYNRRNPFYLDILQIGTKDTYSIEEFFHVETVIDYSKKYPVYIHIDLSLSGDRTGISGVAVTGRKDMMGEDGKKISQPLYTHVFSIALEAPRGDKIPYAKITEFLCWLRRIGFDIQGISRDQYQSEYLAQLLEAQGFDVDLISVDRTPDPYLGFRSVLLEQRIDMLDVKLLQDELVHLQRDATTGKVDHMVGKSKDVADSIAGAIWNAMKKNPGISLQSRTISSAIAAVNKPRVLTPDGTTLPAMFPGLYKK